MCRYVSDRVAMPSLGAWWHCRLMMVLIVVAMLAACALRSGSKDAAQPARDVSVAGRLDHYPLGSQVRLGLASGDTASGALVSVDASTVVIEPAGAAALRIGRASIVAVNDATPTVHKEDSLLRSLGYAGLGLALLILLAGALNPRVLED